MHNIVPGFLTIERLSNFNNKLLTTTEYFTHFLLVNSPLIYTIYTNQFNTQIFLFSYFLCGFFQGFINTVLYYISDILFFGKLVDVNEWKKTKFYEIVVYNTDATYLYVIGAMAYTSYTVVPKSLQWTLEYPGYTISSLQLIYLFFLHDIFFYIIHFGVHKIRCLRIPHLKWHHECPFEIGNSRCAIATEGSEGLLRDLYSATIPTYIISYFHGPFYGYNWILYYSFYSFWAMYIHTGKNKYHLIHHSNNSFSNYGLYYLSDFLMGTLKL